MKQTETLEQVRREGRERLYPSLTNPSWLILRKRRQLFLKWLRGLPSVDLHVLDVGGRLQPYRPLLGDACVRYVAVDLRITPLVDVVGQAEQLPLASNHFDLVFCTQVLEYVPDPALVIAEIHRVLKPGGWLLLSVPAVFPRDSDREYWRFLPSAIQRLLSCFARVELAPEGNSLAGMFRTASVCLTAFARPAALGALLRFTLVPLLNLSGAALETLLPSANDQFTANFSALAQK